ncbi:hypothetical protein [Flavobacterium sp. ov086]|uniref:hypothetical protein n=1 Tax=Flavobacterium sp. ov086 TaxID=1761785 RepID=UPI000B70314C|nr:hypothetical protein [Flavobacterium sp. ov086]SNR93427.1 hypothetical protein SAMN04487979_13220 [Flavobacterium sp. ov086]
MENSNENESKKTLSTLAILLINIFIFITYLFIGFSSDLPDSMIGFMLFIHVGICIIFGGISKRSVWYIAAGIIALPLISLIFSYI